MGGQDENGKYTPGFGYYEVSLESRFRIKAFSTEPKLLCPQTIAGGSGAGPTWHGTSGVHTHVSQTFTSFDYSAFIANLLCCSSLDDEYSCESYSIVHSTLQID